MEDSILDTTKKMIGIDPENTEFDLDILMNINSVLARLSQLGAGPAFGFAIQDKTAMWADFLGPDPRLNLVKSFMFSSVKLAFDPPQSSYHTTALKEQIEKLEWLITVEADNQQYIPAVVVLDGGSSGS